MSTCYHGILQRQHIITGQKSYLLSIEPRKWINREDHAKLFPSIEALFDAEKIYNLKADTNYYYYHLGKYPYEC